MTYCEYEASNVACLFRHTRHVSKDGRYSDAGETESKVSSIGAAVTVRSKGTNGSVDVGRVS